MAAPTGARCPFAAAAAANATEGRDNAGGVTAKRAAAVTPSTSGSTSSSMTAARMPTIRSSGSISSSGDSGSGSGASASTNATTQATASTAGAARPAAATAEPPSPPLRTAHGTFQAWRRTRDAADGAAARLTRRELRREGERRGGWTLAEVKAHACVDDGWVAIAGRVYDVTEHLLNHPGWDGAGVSTVLSIVAALGTDCTHEFNELHRPWPAAWRQLAAFDIGALRAEE